MILEEKIQLKKRVNHTNWPNSWLMSLDFDNIVKINLMLNDEII
jgi:hypothetical protein